MTFSIVSCSASIFFMAQMRHMHPMVETYLQNLKNDESWQRRSRRRISIFLGASTCPTAQRTSLS